MTPSPEPPGYDEVRRKLVERGYLQGRIERFLLKDLLAPGRSARRLARTALKAAILGGPLLGALLSGAAVAANRPLMGARDAFVLWGYFAVLAGAALFALDLAAAGIVTALARRRGARPSDTLRAALLVGVPTLAYLVVLWWRRIEGAGTAGDLLFLAAAVVATVLLAWLAGIVSLAGIVGRTGEVPDRRRRQALALAAVFAAGAAAFAVLPRAGEADARPVPSAPFDAEPGRPMVVMWGVDGLDGEMIEALSTRGAVDGVLAAMARGAVFPFVRPAGLEPPEVWTTIATGVPADVHGVRSAGVERLPGIAAPLRPEAGPVPLEAALRFLLPGRTVPTTGAIRRVRALWEIVALREPSAAVGWWASWPAREGDGAGGRGYVVSDRVLAKLLAGAPEDRDTAPASLFERLRSGFEEGKAADRHAFEAAFPHGEGAGAAAWESFLIDAFAISTADTLLGDASVRAAFVYLPGLDILRDRLGPQLREASMARRLEAQETLEAYVRWLDGRLSAELAVPGRTSLVVADPGRAAGPAAEGFVLVSGPAARAGCVGPVAGPLDVAPLALGLAGFPASAEMPGREPAACLEGFRARERVASFGRRGSPAGAAPSDFDPEMIERLRSLGYVR